MSDDTNESLNQFTEMHILNWFTEMNQTYYLTLKSEVVIKYLSYFNDQIKSALNLLRYAA